MQSCNILNIPLVTVTKYDVETFTFFKYYWLWGHLLNSAGDTFDLIKETTS